MTDGALMLSMLAVSAGMVVIILFGGRGPRRRTPVTQRQTPTFDPNDLSELTNRFNMVDKEHRTGRQRQATELHRRLDLLIRDRAPVRAIAAPAPNSDATNIRFADGTTLRVRANPEHLAPLAEAAGRFPVWLSAYRVGPPGLRLTFDSRSGRVTTVQLGVDHSR